MPGAGDDQPPDQVRILQGDLLRDTAAEGEAEQVDVVVTECADKRRGVSGHGGDRVRDLAAGAADPAVVEGDDVALLGDRVDHAGVPVVQDRREVVQKHERGSPARAQLPVGERRATDI